ncbi:hypothetical protein ACMZ62_03780 [Streptococcus pluranimalium]
MKKTFVTLATVAALVAAATPVFATQTDLFVEDIENNPNTVQHTPATDDQAAREATPAPTFAEENLTPGNPGEEQFETVEIPVDVDGDGKTDRIDVKRVSTGVWVNKGEEAKSEEAKSEEAKSEEAKSEEAKSEEAKTEEAKSAAKPAAKSVAKADTAKGQKVLPKTSAVK